MTLAKLLDSSLREVRRLQPISLSISEKSVPLSTASMRLPADQAIPDRSWVELFTVNGSAGIYRSRTPLSGYGNRDESYTLEHAVCEVGDWLVRAEIGQTQKTLAAALTQVFSYYGGSRWQLGTVSASGNVILSANYSNLLQTMNSLIAQVKGAVMTFDFSTTPWTINVVQMSGTVTAEGRLSRNVQSAKIKKDDTNLCTRVWLDSLSGGKMDADTVSTYGVIEKKLQDKSYTQAQAQTVASAYLERYKRPAYSITVDGIDFYGITGETLDRVEIGKMYRLAIPEENIVAEYNIVALSWRDTVNAPNVVIITLSEPDNTLVDFISQQNSEMNGAGGTVETQNSVNNAIRQEVAEAVSGLSSSITQTASQIRLEVSDSVNSLKSSITLTASQIRSEVSNAVSGLSSSITQTASQIRSEVNNAVSGLNSSITQTASQIRSEVNNAVSGLKSSITQTASQIRQEVSDSANGLSASITTTASQIRQEVSDSANGLQGSITTTASQIRTEVRNSLSGVYAAIDVTESQIRSEVVGKDGVISAINQSAEAITISAGRVDLQGYVTATSLETNYLTASQIQAAYATVANLNATNTWITNLTNGTTQAGYIHTATLSTGVLTFGGYNLRRGYLTVDGTTFSVVMWD